MSELEAALAHANNYRADAHHRALAVEISRLRLELERQSTMDMQMSVLMRERDALAKRWEAIKSHVVGVDDDACVPAVDEWDAGWSEAFSDVREKMRELEAQR